MIGAGSVVTKDIPPLAVAVGNPARIVRYRNKENYENSNNDIILNNGLQDIFNHLHRSIDLETAYQKKKSDK